MIKSRAVVTRAAAAITAGIVVLFLAPPNAYAATYTVRWNTNSSPYAYGYAYTTTNCTLSGTLLDNSHTSASGKRSIKSPGYTEYMVGSGPGQTWISYNTCYTIPGSGLWYGYDPAR